MNSRVPSGRAVAVLGAIGASLALGGLLLDRTDIGPVLSGSSGTAQTTLPAAAAYNFSLIATAEARPLTLAASQPSPLILPAPSAPTASPVEPAPTALSQTHAIMPAAHRPVAAPTRPAAKQLIPPVKLPDQLSPPPQPREALPLQTDLLPLAPPPAAPPNQSAS